MVYNPEKRNRKSVRLNGYDYSQPGFYYVTICTQDRIERFGGVLDAGMVFNEYGKMVDVEWNQIPERYEHVVLDKYQIMPNHMHGILQIVSTANGNDQTIDSGIVGTSLVGVLNNGGRIIGNVVNDLDGTIGNGCMEGNNSIETDHNHDDESDENPLKMVDVALERTPIKDVPTLGSIIGTFKSITTTNYAGNVRNSGWPPFMKRLWQLRCHDHIIRNKEELNRIRKHIEDNPKNWANDENNPENRNKNDETGS